MHVNIRVELNKDLIQEQGLGFWKEELDYNTITWTDVYETIAVSYIAAGEYSAYVIGQVCKIEE